MDSTAPELAIQRYDVSGIDSQQDDILRAYTEVYAEQLDDPFFSTPRYWQRLEAYAARAGFTLATGRLGNELIGYMFGYTLPADSRWWHGLRGDVDSALFTETGRRTFAVTDLLVRPPWRRRGYARALHDTLLLPRPEARATLLVLPDNIPARTAYLAWGWHKLGELQPFDDAPVFDAMVRELPAGPQA